MSRHIRQRERCDTLDHFFLVVFFQHAIAENFCDHFPVGVGVKELDLRQSEQDTAHFAPLQLFEALLQLLAVVKYRLEMPPELYASSHVWVHR